MIIKLSHMVSACSHDALYILMNLCILQMILKHGLEMKWQLAVSLLLEEQVSLKCLLI